MKIALCTIVLGDRYQHLFRTYAEPSWKSYCETHGFHLIVFDRILRSLPGKSLAWQKLFILGEPELKGFERIIFADSDILIRSRSPSIIEGLPLGKIGYVAEPYYTGKEGEWYSMFKLPVAPIVVQTGVLCLEPDHRGILEEAARYPETSMYEMPALSLTIAQSEKGHAIDPRFNALVGTLIINDVPPWMVGNKLIKEALWALRYPPLHRSVRKICQENFFIHAAGAKRDLRKIHKELAGDNG